MEKSSFDKKGFTFFLKFMFFVFFLIFTTKYGMQFAINDFYHTSKGKFLNTTHTASLIFPKDIDVYQATPNIITEKKLFPPINFISKEGEITIGWVGDIPPSNTIPRFSKTVYSRLNENDILAGNLEGVLSDNPKNFKCSAASINCFSFIGNNKFAESLNVIGFDILNFANNHIFDKKEVGILTTKSILNDNSLSYSPENGDVVVRKINDIDVAFLSFGHNMWTKKITDISSVNKIIKDTSIKYPVVIVFFHGGAEGRDKGHIIGETEYYLNENRGNVYLFAHTAIDAGADLVLGSGPHIVRGIEKYKDRLIIYSAGNFLTTKGILNTGLLGKGAVFNITINKVGLYKKLSILSTTGEIKNVVYEDVSNEGLNQIIKLTKQDFGQDIKSDLSGNIIF